MSNATYATFRCKWCGCDQVDDTDSGLTTHEKVCKVRRSKLFWRGVFLFAVVSMLANIIGFISWVSR